MKAQIRKIDKWVLQHKPEIWLTRTHWIFLFFIIVFAVENSSIGNVFLFVDSSLILFALFSIMVLPVVFWLRFQFTYFIPFFKYGHAYRIFLFNVLGLLMFFMMVFYPIINNDRKYDDILNECGKKK